jgi:TatD DNase family protein
MFPNSTHLFCDLHSHQKTESSQNWQLLNITLPKDNLEIVYSTNQTFSVGLHPWFLEKNYQEQIQKIIQVAENENVLAIGETGLDKTIHVGFLCQLEVFRRHIAISEKVQKPLIVHCVKAYNEILNLHKQLQPSQNWLIHGFRANIQIAKQLQQKGIYLSFGKALLKSPKLQETFAQIQSEYFFLETDDSTIAIEEIYEKAAQIRNTSLKEIQNQIKQNLCKFFGKKITFLQ